MNKIEFNGYRVDCLTDFALEFLNSRKIEKPLFLFISYLEPHQQNDENRFVGPDGSKEKFNDHELPGDLKNFEGDYKENFADYLGCCHSIDVNLKRIQDKLDELNMTDNTILIFTSDHGCHFRTRNMEYKRSCHDASIHIPLIIKGPGFEGGREIKELISLIDLPPTLLTMAGVNVPNYMRGRPIQKLINENLQDWPEEVFLQISESQVGRAIRTKKWKYSVKAPKKDGWLYAKSNVYMEDFLYDLKNDIFERNNLVEDPKYQEIKKKLAERLKRKMVEAGEDIPVIIPKSS